METRCRRWLALVLGALLIALPGCSRGREYELRGQVLVVDAARKELTIAHGDIPGFMPGMTMAFKVREARLMEGRSAGELVTATLVVDDGTAHVSAVARTGFAAISEPHLPTRVMELVEPGDAVRDAALLDEQGGRRRLADWRGRVLAVTFVYTRCPLPHFCPAMDRHFKRVQEMVRGDEQLRDSVQLLSVSFDPDHDSPAVLARHAADRGAVPATWRFLTGDREEVETFAAQFGVSLLRADAAGAEIVHNLRTAVIDPEGRLVTTLSGGEWTPDELVSEIRRARASR
jgi:protein SCO1